MINIYIVIIFKNHWLFIPVPDICENRLEFAKKLGATHPINVKDKKVEDLVEEIRVKAGREPDVSIECSGAASSVKLAVLVSFLKMCRIFMYRIFK